MAATFQTGGIAATYQHAGVNTGARQLGHDLPGQQADVAGLDADIKARQAAKFDVELEQQVVQWIQAVTGEIKIDGQSTHEWLKSGVVLCKLANTIQPGIIAKINTGAFPFKQMENLTFFMGAARKLGVAESSMFGTPALYENKDMGSVIACIYAYGGVVQTKVPSFTGPKLGHAVAHQDPKDRKRIDAMATSQYEAMQRTMEVERPKDAGITMGSDPKYAPRGLIQER